MTFGAAAVRLCGAAARMLGWGPSEFWAATPDELAACLQPADPTTDTSMTLAELLSKFPDERASIDG